jgi:hypothetical protein
MSYELLDDEIGGYAVAIDVRSQAITLTRSDNKNWKGTLHYERVPSSLKRPEKMILDGSMDGHPAHLELELEDRANFPLVKRGFHWVQEYPYNR